MGVASQATVTIYEVSGEDSPVGSPRLRLESHWNDRGMIVLKPPRGKSLTVSVKDLMEAIRRCSE